MGDAGWVLDPYDLSTLYQDAASAVPVTTDGDPVRVVTDKGPTANNAVAPTDAQRATFRDVGGEKYLAGDGIDDTYLSPVSTPIGAGFYAIAAIRVNNLDGAAVVGSYFGAASGGNVQSLGFRGSGGGVRVCGGTVRINSSTQFGIASANGSADAFSVGQLFLLEAWHDGATLNMRFNGRSPLTIAANTLGAVSSAPLALNMNVTTSNEFHGGAYINRLVTQDERDRCLEYYAAKLGITL